MGGSRLSNLKIIARIGFPIIDRIFPEGTPYKIPSLINPGFAEKTDVYTKFKEYRYGSNRMVL